MRAGFRKFLPPLLFATAVLWGLTCNLAANDNSDPLIGVWKLDVRRSRYTPGYRIPLSQIFTYEVTDEGVKFTSDTVEQKGNSTHSEYTANYDGKAYPVESDRNRDNVVLRRIDVYRTAGVSKKKGKVTSSFRRTVSLDGQTLTITSKGNRDGKPYKNIAVYHKQ